MVQVGRRLAYCLLFPEVADSQALWNRLCLEYFFGLGLFFGFALVQSKETQQAL